MTKKIFVNLPVRDVQASRVFYEALGYTINEAFSDETAASVVISEHIYLMVMVRDRFAGFVPKPVSDTLTTTGALMALSCENRAEVDAMMTAATANGGTDNDKLQDMEGFMYLRSFCDPDGHVFEPFWMNPEAVPG